MIGLPMVKSDDKSSHFHTVHKCDRQTDEQKDHRIYSTWIVSNIHNKKNKDNN